MWLHAYHLFILTLCRVSAASGNEFPKDFLFGAGSAAYQAEGAWNISDKGESIWDRFCHTRPDMINVSSNGDVATDSYHKFKEDVQLIKNIGANTYRFSLSWPRILPNGFPNHISEDGVRYYNDLINECISNDIIPMVTLYHWDLPQKLQDLGGWTNPDIALWFADYAEVAFKLFGDRVTMWTTMNEPLMVCVSGHGLLPNSYAPALIDNGNAAFWCVHHILIAHARAYAIYVNKYRPKQNGKVGISLYWSWLEPADNTSIADIAASERALDFFFGSIAHSLFTIEGDYSESFKASVLKSSGYRGYDKTYSPAFTRKQIEDIRYSADFVGINYYKSFKVLEGDNDQFGFHIQNSEDVVSLQTIKNTPWGLSKLVQTMTSKYELPDIYITENGYRDFGGLIDLERTTYLHDHLKEVLKIIRNGIDVKGYVVWSLTDNFQWIEAYGPRFGIFEVDFNKPDRPRTPKLSSKFITEVYSTGKIPDLSDFIHSNQSIRNSLDCILICLTFCHIMFSR